MSMDGKGLFPDCTVPTINTMGSPILNTDEQNDLFSSLEQEYINSDFINSIERSNFHQDVVYPDVKYNIPTRPIDQIGPPDKKDFPGLHKFEANVIIENNDRKQFLYSRDLNKVYLVMLAELPIEFKWDRSQCGNQEWWVRATVVFAGSDSQESRVIRCHNHKVVNDASNRDVPTYIHSHVLRSVRQSDDVMYCGDENNDQHWLSVAFRLRDNPPRSSNFLSHVYKFYCKHSCTSGINRRKIEVLFTLENSSGEILGRKSIGVRVCSCPKRDMEKDLNEYRPKTENGPSHKRPRIVNSKTGPAYILPQYPSATNPVQNNHDSTPYQLNVEVLGQHIYNNTLTYAYNAMAAELLHLPLQSEERVKYLQCMADIQSAKQLL